MNVYVTHDSRAAELFRPIRERVVRGCHEGGFARAGVVAFATRGFDADGTHAVDVTRPRFASLSAGLAW